MIKFYLRLVLLLLISTQPVWSQSVLDPNDPVVTYNSANPPTQPAWGAIGKWVRTVRVSWNTDSYKCYIYKGMQFRLKFPKNFNAADTSKKYPIIIFFHGIGEKGSLYDNEYQLYHGGQTHMNKVDNGTFDGFLLYPQNTSGYFGNTQYDLINELINNFFIQQLNVDRWRVMIEGLSGGGMATWDFLFRYPKLVAAATPISAANSTYDDYLNSWKYTPLWQFQGGVDPNPNPGIARSIEAAAQAAGANYKLTVYEGMGHSVWNTAWAEADYFPFMNRAYKSNPWALYGKTEFCPGETVNITLGLTTGFTAYQWSKDGTVIPGATGNTLNVTEFGTYAARVRDGNVWSDWSHTPVVVKQKAPTVTPAIQMLGLQSNVLPTPEGKDSVTLALPNGYASYIWMKSGGTDTLGRAATFTAHETGSYIARVTELYGCSSSFSDPFPVIKASGSNGPDAANGLLVTPLSKTSLKLNWSDKPSPLYNETLFEVYRATTAGGPYTLVGTVGADVLTFTDNGLLPNTRYYYIIRAVNNNAAAPLSPEASGVTMVDQTPPTAPGNLTVTGSTTSSISISWTAATDDVGVDKYDIYINGKKTYTVDNTITSFIAYGLKERQVYTIAVRARDVTGNQSPASNQVSAGAIKSGLSYKYYTGSWTKLPNFSTLTPVKTGTVPKVDISPALSTTNYGFVWEGIINIPVTGSYTFETYSDDGSRMYIDQPSYSYTATPLVDNDGGHGAQYKQGTKTLSKGPHYIVVTFFQGGGSQKMQLFWKNTAGGVGSTRQEVPASYFSDTITLGNVPAAPTNQAVAVVSYSKLKVSWKDNSTNESNFEIYRSTSSNGTYNIITTTAPNVTSYTDTLLNPSTTYYYKVKAINVAGGSALTAAANAKTAALPAVPTAPNTLVATAVTSDKINLQWKDNSTNETGFEVYRSANNNANYVLIATVGANSTTQATFADSALFPNAKYYYKVRAKNDGGFSAYSNEAFDTTLNNIPQIRGLADRTMRYGTQISYDISTYDPDDEPVSLTTANTPAFASFSAYGETGITMTLSPASPADIGVYNIQIIATDQHGGVSNRTITVTVDDNYQPSLNAIPNVSLAEKAATQFTLHSNDQNTTDTTIWTVTGLPAFATLTPRGDSALVQLAPGYADAGTYPVTVKVDDNKGGTDTKSFTITVTDVNPNYKVNINFTEGSYQASAPWYNTNKRPVLNDVFTNINDVAGNSSGISFTILTPWQNINGGVNTNNLGYTTGGNSGFYPDNVMNSAWFTQYTTQSMRFAGLKPHFKYSFTIFGSRNDASDARVGIYTINGNSVTLNASNNTNQTVTIYNVRADSTGGVTLDMQPAAGSQTGYAYINALVINAEFDDSTAPAKPGNFAARTLTQGVRLSWTDQAYNETAYQLYRAASKADTFALISTLQPNDTAYTDLGATSGNTWYYLARAINGYGASPFTDTVSILVPNQPPVLAAIANVVMKSDTTKQVAISATDAPGDTITFSASGFPAFASLTNTGNGTASLNLAPATSDIGKYTLKVIASDNKGDTSSQTFTVQVTDKKVTSIYVNCNQVEPAAAPWNNFNTLPNANAGVSNLLDEAGNASGIGITVLDGMTGANNVGAVTGDNTGVYPDAVMKTFFYDQSGTEKRVRLSGLSTSRKYNLVFFASRAGVSDNRNTVYTANGQSVTLNAASNISNTVQLNGLTPDGSGNIIFTIKQASGSPFSYLNAVVIQSYVDDGKPLAPANLVATSGSRSAIQLNWADKSNNETGYEVYRSASRNGSYTLLGTVGANVTAYKDSSLSANSVFYYKVRAVAGTLYSDYSNIATGGTLAYGLYLNFCTTATIAPAPWNNTAALPYEGQTFANLSDDGGNTTSISMTIINNFTGTNPAGWQTGNNSGVYPDKVMAESYYTETDTARIKISGLDQAKQYSFTFFASRASGGTRITAYIIGTKMVTLDANDNATNTVTIENVKPDGNGEIIVTMYTVLNYGYLNAMVIKAFPPDDSTNLQSLPNYNTGGVMGNARNTNTIGLSGALAPTVQPAAATLNDNGVDGITVENAYPNPFTTFINLSIRQKQDARILIRLLDGNGRLILAKDLGNRSSGVYQERIDVGSRELGHGLYLLQILSENKPVKTIKLIRN